TEPDAGSETTRISTFARKEGGGYRVNGRKIFISRAEHSDLMLLLARTTRYEDVADKTTGLSLFLFDLGEAVSDGSVNVSPIRVMQNHHTTEVVIDDLWIAEENLVGTEGSGFRHI